MTKRSLTKLQVAEIQLADAILMFFEEKDSISILTVVEASLQILEDLAKIKGIDVPFYKNADRIKPEYKKEWVYHLTKHRNFFKHADRDPDSTIEFDSEFVKLKIMTAICYHEQLVDYYILECFIFNIWLNLNEPNLFINDYEMTDELKSQLINQDKDTFKQTINHINPNVFTKFKKPMVKITKTYAII